MRFQSRKERRAAAFGRLVVAVLMLGAPSLLAFDVWPYWFGAKRGSSAPGENGKSRSQGQGIYRKSLPAVTPEGVGPGDRSNIRRPAHEEFLVRTTHVALKMDSDGFSTDLLGTPWGSLYLWKHRILEVREHRFVEYRFAGPTSDTGRKQVSSEGGLPAKYLSSVSAASASNEDEAYPVIFSKKRHAGYIAHDHSFFSAPGSVALWELDHSVKLDDWYGKSDYVSGLVVSPDERMVGIRYYFMGNGANESVLLYKDEVVGEVSGWNTAFHVVEINHTNSQIFVSDGAALSALAEFVSPEPRRPADNDNAIYVREIHKNIHFDFSRTLRPTELQIECRGSPDLAAFSPDDKVLAIASDIGELQFFDVLTASPIARPLELGARVDEMQFIGSSELLVLRTQFGCMHVCERATGKQRFPALSSPGLINGMQLSEDNEILYTWDGPFLRAWRLDTGDRYRRPIAFPESISGVFFGTGYDSTALLWSRDGQARLYNLTTAEPLSPLFCHGGAIDGALFNKRRVLTWDSTGTIREWRVPVLAAQSGSTN